MRIYMYIYIYKYKSKYIYISIQSYTNNSIVRSAAQAAAEGKEFEMNFREARSHGDGTYMGGVLKIYGLYG